MSTTQYAFTSGKYLITPITRQDKGGSFTSVVSIRSGRGSSTHDKIFTFSPRFASQDSALRYAASEGRKWLAARDRAAA